MKYLYIRGEKGSEKAFPWNFKTLVGVLRRRFVFDNPSEPIERIFCVDIERGIVDKTSKEYSEALEYGVDLSEDENYNDVIKMGRFLWSVYNSGMNGRVVDLGLTSVTLDKKGNVKPYYYAAIQKAKEDVVRREMKNNNYNIKRVAEILGIRRRTVYTILEGMGYTNKKEWKNDQETD